MGSGCAPQRSESLRPGARRVARTHQAVDYRLHGRDLWPGLPRRFIPGAIGFGSVTFTLLAGVLTVLVVNRKYFINLPHAVSNGTLGALIAIANTAAVVGFGTIAVTLIAGLTGPASGGQAIALPMLAPHYLGLGVDANALHRVIAIASGGLDSLPHNGYVVTTIRGVCRETHKSAYWPMFRMTVLVPLSGLVVALLLL